MVYIPTNTIKITDNQNNTINYSGNLNNDIFSNSNTITSFTNSGIILGGGGSVRNPGKNGLINFGSITTLTNTGAFLGGGGGGNSNWGHGGAGGGGGSSVYWNSTGGSLYSGPPTGPGAGGGPGQDGGGGNATGYGGIPHFGPFGGGGADDYLGTAATINGGGNGGMNYGSGGGYGGGNGGSTYGGAGGGGGGRGGIGWGNYNNDGGYSIRNNGTITTLINSQGGLISNKDPNNYPYGPLFYCGNSPTNYKIIIKSTNEYGQLWCTGVKNTIGSITFSIADDSILSNSTYNKVLKFNLNTVKLNNTSGSYGGYSWNLVKNSTSTYESYDLLVTMVEKCFIKDSNNNMKNICIEYPYNKCNYTLSSIELKCYQERYPNDLINMTNPDLQNHWSTIGCKQNRDNQCPAPQKTSALYNFKGCYNSGEEGLINYRGKVSSVNECSTITENNQETLFGIKNYGECWTGNNEKKTLQYGENYDLVNCSLLGGPLTNQVYIRSKPYPPPPPPIPKLTRYDFLNEKNQKIENFESIKKYDRNNIIFILILTFIILILYFYIIKK